MYTFTKEQLITAPTIEPVSVEELRAHCYVLDHEVDDLLEDFITAARKHLEEICWSAFITQTWQIWWDGFETRLYVPRPPLQSVTWLKYYPASGSDYTEVSTNIYETGSESGWWYIRQKYQQTYPSLRGHYDDVTSQVVVGYGDAASDVPMPIRQAIKLLAAHLYMNRGDEAGQDIPRAVWDLIENYRFKRM